MIVDNSPTLMELLPREVPALIRFELRALTWDDRRPDLVFTPDGRYAAVAFGCDILLVDGRRGRIVRMLSGHRSEVRDLSFSYQGPQLASITADGTLKLWNWLSGMEEASIIAQQPGRNRVAFSSDGGILATAGDDEILRYWCANLSGTSCRAFGGRPA